MATMWTNGNGKVTTVSRHHAIKVHRCVKAIHFGFGLRERIKTGFKIPFHSKERAYATPCPRDLMALTACQKLVLERQICLTGNTLLSSPSVKPLLTVLSNLMKCGHTSPMRTTIFM